MEPFDDDVDEDADEDEMFDDFDPYLDWVPPTEIPVEDDAPPCKSDMEDFWDRFPRI